MKIIKRNSDNVVLYAGDDLALTETQASGDSWADPSLTTANATLEQATPPAGWVGAAWAYTGSAWVVVDAPRVAQITSEAAKAAVPQFVTMRQARLALMAAGLLNTVNTTIAAMPGAQGDAARIEWEFSSEVKRNQPLVMALGPTLGLSAAQLDALFVAAAKV